MLRNVLGAYLDNATERQLDLPVMALLAAMGFTDIHYTHGHVEFGKDMIAKRVAPGTLPGRTYKVGPERASGSAGQYREENDGRAGD